MKKVKTNWTLIISLLLIGAVFLLLFSDYGTSGEKISATEAITIVENGQVSDFYAQGGVAKIKLATGSKVAPGTFPKQADYHFKYTTTSLEIVLEAIENFNQYASVDNKINWNIEPESPSFIDQIYPYLFLLMIVLGIFLVYKMLSSSNKGAMNFGKSRAKAVTNVKVRFADVAGADEEKEELKEIVEFLKNPQKFISLGARIPKGVLLVGPPGTGKTLLARAVAGESNVPFLSISGSDFVEMFVGVGASRVRDLFEEAKRNLPCIVFIDEIDAVGRQRGAGLGGGNDEREQTLNQLLVEMDGFEANEGIVILAATNRSDVLDPALLRPGRFDRQIYVHVPDVKGREGIIKIHAKNKPIDESVNFETLARITSGFTGADIENMLNEAAILAARANRPRIIMEDLTEGINKVIMGPQKRSRVVTERDKKITAYHESGHAILGKVLPHCEPIQEVSIIPRGGAAGYTMSRPENDDSHMTFNRLNDEIAMIMGGRIAEEIIFKDITTGASSDIQKATQLARKMVTEWGMSEIGFMAFEGEDRLFIGRDYQTKNNYSEKMAANVDEEILKILNYNYGRAKQILQDNIEMLHNMSELLLQKETIYHDEVELLFEKKSVEEIIAIMNERESEKLKKAEELKKIMQQELVLKELDQKVETGKIYLKNGIITPADLERLLVKRKEQYDKLQKMKQEVNSSKESALSVQNETLETEKPAKKRTKKVAEKQEETAELNKEEAAEKKPSTRKKTAPKEKQEENKTEEKKQNQKQQKRKKRRMNNEK